MGRTAHKVHAVSRCRRVEFRLRGDGNLQSRAGNVSRWTHLCTHPCSVERVGNCMARKTSDAGALARPDTIATARMVVRGPRARPPSRVPARHGGVGRIIADVPHGSAIARSVGQLTCQQARKLPIRLGDVLHGQHAPSVPALSSAQFARSAWPLRSLNTLRGTFVA